jgi:hypothetical protein
VHSDLLLLHGSFRPSLAGTPFHPSEFFGSLKLNFFGLDSILRSFAASANFVPPIAPVGMRKRILI